MTHRLRLSVAAIAAAFATFSTSAHAAQTIKLTAVSGYAPTAAWVNVFQTHFIPELDKKLAAKGNYKIEWNQAWGTIAKPRGELDALENGLADIGIVQTVFHPDKLPMFNIGYVTPFITTDIDLMTRTVNELARTYPVYKSVWAKHNQVFLTTLAGVDNYQLVLKAPIAKPADLKGRKICGAGLNLRYVEGLGAVGVSSPLPDWYNNIRGGICDGTIVWPEAAQNFKLYEVAPTYVDVTFGGANSMALSMNANSWKKLPQEVKDAVDEVSETYRKALARKAMSDSAASTKAYASSGGKIVAISPADRAAWANSLPNLAAEWADSLEKAGIPGKQILRSYIDAMKAANQTILRDWSK